MFSPSHSFPIGSEEKEIRNIDAGKEKQGV